MKGRQRRRRNGRCIKSRNRVKFKKRREEEEEEELVRRFKDVLIEMPMTGFEHLMAGFGDL